MKKITTLISALLIGIQSLLLAQPNIVWEKTFGGSANDEPSDILATADGNYLVLCTSFSNDGDLINSHGKADIWLLKLSPSGQLIWQKTYGGSEDDGALKIISTPDGGYLLLGISKSKNGDVSANYGGYDIWLLKINQDGEVLWQKNYGGSLDDFGATIIQAEKGNFILSASTQSSDFDIPSNNYNMYDMWIIKINSSGDIIWSKIYGGNSVDFAGPILSTSDGGYVVFGSSGSKNGDFPTNYGSYDTWVFKIDSIGTIQWKNVQGGASDEFTNNIFATDDGGYLVVGQTDSNTGPFSENHGSMDLWVYKLSATGMFKWRKFYGGSYADRLLGAAQSKDGNLILGGQALSMDGDLAGSVDLYKDAWLLCIDKTGSIIWGKTCGGSEEDVFGQIEILDDGEIIVAGNTKSSDGDVQSGKPSNAEDLWVVRLGNTSGTKDISSKPSDLKFAPNPASNYIEISSEEILENCTISIAAINGPVLLQQTLDSSRRIDVSSIPRGTYILKSECLGKSGGSRMIKL